MLPDHGLVGYYHNTRAPSSNPQAPPSLTDRRRTGGKGNGGWFDEEQHRLSVFQQQCRRNDKAHRDVSVPNSGKTMSERLAYRLPELRNGGTTPMRHGIVCTNYSEARID